MSAAREWVPHHGGPNPFHDPDQPDREEPDIMIRYRNGRVFGPIQPASRRWAAWTVRPGRSDWDIVAWRLA
ncbi:hypothetical protein G432_05110 [Sphingomonas sp. MM-1]|uniref:hypothetical protein n=1 Tax=Sphingomonas sp. MM-1 TaxID=745310 RepID=UPI0002C09BB4|nr:hypothetical protein [Sphingomonas sp. MM-1]AGH48749.1 hypothetical protein G432_05110 [Sphingomonas sp. MM-1]